MVGINPQHITPMLIDLGSQASVRSFVAALNAVCLPRVEEPQRSPEGFEISVATSPVGHFLLMADAAFELSGQHWSRGNRQQAGRAAFAKPLSTKAINLARSAELWTLSEKMVGLA